VTTWAPERDVLSGKPFPASVCVCWPTRCGNTDFTHIRGDGAPRIAVRSAVEEGRYSVHFADDGGDWEELIADYATRADLLSDIDAIETFRHPIDPRVCLLLGERAQMRARERRVGRRHARSR
jgi:hypothetical protein